MSEKPITIKWRDLKANPSLADGLVYSGRSSDKKVNHYFRPAAVEAPAEEVPAKKKGGRPKKGAK